MDEKKFDLFSKGLMIIWEAYLEENGLQAFDSKTVLVDGPGEDTPVAVKAS